MAEEANTLIYDIVINIPKVEENAEKAQAAIARLRAEKIATDKEFKDKKIGVEEYAKSMTSIDTQLKKTQTELRGYQKTLLDNDKATKAAQGSNDQLRAQLSTLTVSYNGLDKVLRNSAGGQALQSRIKSLSDELKTNEAAIGDNRRTVGSYAEAIEQSISGNTNWIGSLRNSAKELTTVKDNTLSYVNGLKASTEGMGAAEKASTVLGLGLKAIGIGLLITAITALIGFLKSTDEGMDAVDRATARVTETFSVLIKGIAPVGKLLVDLFTNPQKVVENLTNKTGVYSVSLAEVARQANEAGKAAAAYKQVLNDVEDAQDQLIGKQALIKEQVDLALLQVKERTKSEGERLEVLQQAGVAERELAVEALEAERKKTVATQLFLLSRVVGEKEAQKLIKSLRTEELLDYINNTNKLTDAQKKQFNESVAGYVQARQAREETEQQIRNRESALIEQEAADRKSAADKAKAAAKTAADQRKQEAKSAADELVAEAQRALIVAKQKKEETLDIEEEIIKRQAKSDLIDAKTKGQRDLINAKAETEIFQLHVENTIKLKARELDIEEAHINEMLALVKEGTGKELMLQVALIQNQANKQREQIKDTVDNKKEQDAKISQIDAETNQKLLNAQKAFVVKQIELQQQKAEAQQHLAESLLARFNNDQKKQLSIEQADVATSLAQAKEGSKAQLDAQLRDIEINRKAAIQSASETGESVEVIKANFRAIDADADRKAADLRKAHLLDQLDKITNVTQQTEAAIDKVIDAQGQVRLNNLQNQENSQLASAGLSAELRGQIEEKFAKRQIEITQENARKKKKIASAENLINTALAVTRAFVDPGGILGAVFAAIALANGFAQQAVIESTTFAKGGVVNGPSHKYGGVKYFGGRVELEGEEGVINKRSMSIPGVRQKASELNQLGGGIAYPGTTRLSGGPILPRYNPLRLEYGGIVSSISGASGGSSIDYNKLGSVVAQMVVQAAAAIPAPRVGIDDITAASDRVKRVQVNADTGV